MPPKRPILSKYPHLRSLLQNDAKANAEFNSALNEVTSQDSFSAELNQALESLQKSESNLQSQINKAAAYEKTAAKSIRFIRLLGELLEAQTNFSPYVEDLAEQRKYQIEFSPAQIRMALRWYWDVIGSSMESAIGRTLILDPALEREDDGSST
jgi:hypothetical protein